MLVKAIRKYGLQALDDKRTRKVDRVRFLTRENESMDGKCPLVIVDLDSSVTEQMILSQLIQRLTRLDSECTRSLSIT